MEQAPDDDQGVQLMLAYQRGDEASFDRLVELYSAQVYALLTRFLGLHQGREDLVQEVFLRVIRARARYEPTARFSTWLYKIVFNLSVNQTQRAGRREQQSAEDGDEHDRALEDFRDAHAADPAQGLEQNDLVQAVRSAIAKLPEQQRMALVLTKYHELPYSEIAHVLGSSEKAVKSLVHRARENLRATLAPYLQGEPA